MKVGGWGEAAPGAMGSVVVVETSKAVDQAVQVGELVGEVVAGVELVAPGAVGALDLLTVAADAPLCRSLNAPHFSKPGDRGHSGTPGIRHVNTMSYA